MALPNARPRPPGEATGFRQLWWRWPAQAIQQDRWLVALIVLLSLARIALIALSWSPTYGWDGDNYIDAARHLMHGTLTEYSVGTLLYPALMAVLVRVFNTIYALFFFQIALSVGAAIGLYYALKPYTRPGAALAACLVAVDPQLGVLQNFVSTDALYATLQILAFSAFMLHMPPRAKPRLHWGLVLGMGLGVAYLIRSAGILAIVPAALVYLLALRSWRHTALLVGGFALMALLLAGWLRLETGSFALDQRYDFEQQVVSNTLQAENPVTYWLTPQRVRYFANFFVRSGQYNRVGLTYNLEPPWAFADSPVVPGLDQFVSWLTKAWDAIGASLWLLFGVAIIVLAPRSPWKWPLLFGILLFFYHAVAVAVFNKIVTRYVTVVSFYRVMMFAFLLTLVIEGFRAWQRPHPATPDTSPAANPATPEPQAE